MNTMQRTIMKVLSIVCLIGLGTVMITRGVSALFAIYNPYPPGILPQNLDSEIARVQGEMTFIFNEALSESKALPPLTLAGQPPTLQGSGYQSVEVLGKLMNFDLNMSPFKNVACSSCHMPYAAFSGPIPSVNLTMIAYPGTFRYRAGKRTAQIHLFTEISCTQLQRDAATILWRKLLGRALDRIQAAECRRRAGAASSGRHSGNG